MSCKFSNLPRLAVLGSGKGSNFIAIQNAIEAKELIAEIAVVISDNPSAGILERARSVNIPTETLPPSPFKTKLSVEGELELLAIIKNHEADWIILAGYMRVVKDPLLSAFPQRIINIHPSLLPQFPGLRAWEQALKAGVAETGCTVHYVNEVIDAGQVIAQARVPVLPGDSPESLHARIQEAEHRLFPHALSQVFNSFLAAP